MMELVVMLDSKSSGLSRVGSSPTTGTNKLITLLSFIKQSFWIVFILKKLRYDIIKLVIIDK